MTNREWLRSLTDEELADFFIDDKRSLNGGICNICAADIFIEIVQLPEACAWCTDDSDICDCTRGITGWLQSEDTSRQHS